MGQVYFLEVVYLVASAMMLLSDSHGARIQILLSLRYAFRSVRWVRLFFVWGGMLLGLLSIFVPYAPGPMLLGDFLVTLTLFPLTFWHVSQARRLGRGSAGDMVDAATLAIERHKGRWGCAVLCVALIHFLFPMIVLL